MKIEKIDHVAILVKDTEAAGKFFGDLFETKFSPLEDMGREDVRSIIEPSGIELIQPLDPNGPTASSLKSRGEGFYVLSLKVSNLDEAMTEMKSRGIRLVDQVKSKKARAALYHPKDTYGVIIELVEYETEHALTATIKH